MTEEERKNTKLNLEKIIENLNLEDLQKKADKMSLIDIFASIIFHKSKEYLFHTVLA